MEIRTIIKSKDSSIDNRTIYFKMLTILFSIHFNQDPDLFKKLGIKYNVEKYIEIRFDDIHDNFSMIDTIKLAYKFINKIKLEDFDLTLSLISQEVVGYSLRTYRGLYFNMLENESKNDNEIKEILYNLLKHGIDDAVKDEDYESASLFQKKLDENF